MLKTGLLALLAMGGVALAQSNAAMECCDKCGESAMKEMACCANSKLSKDDIKARLKAANSDLKLSDAKIDKIAAALAAASNTKHDCCDKKKSAESGACCE